MKAIQVETHRVRPDRIEAISLEWPDPSRGQTAWSLNITLFSGEILLSEFETGDGGTKAFNDVNEVWDVYLDSIP